MVHTKLSDDEKDDIKCDKCNRVFLSILCLINHKFVAKMIKVFVTVRSNVYLAASSYMRKLRESYMWREIM